MMNFNGIFKRNVTYDNIESHQKPSFLSLFLSLSLFLFLFFSLTNTISEKQQGGEGRVKLIRLSFFSVNKFVNLL